MQRYNGTLPALLPRDRNGFIKLETVKRSDGSPHGLATTKDIYVHQDDCGSPLRPHMDLSFEVTRDTERGGDALRAVDVMECVSGELVLVGEESGASRALADPRSLYVPPTPAQRMGMKPIAPEAVDKVTANRPMPLVPRTHGGRTEDAAEITHRLMQQLFPQFAAINEDGVDMADERFDEVIKAAIADHKALGMEAQAGKMLSQANTYKGLRMLLRSEEDLLKPETLIPIQYLPDLFMAVPVWYFFTDDRVRVEVAALEKQTDPQVHPKLTYFCDQLPNPRWIDTFLMYNRRMRTLADYRGDLIPPRIVARMRKMAPMFDHLVIMTPYHDVAGKDWEDVAWLRSIDPYVVGFTNGVPLMFVLGRFSDSGTFPLYSELVADTIAFLRANILKLRGFDRVSNAYWYRPGRPNFFMSGRPALGTHLVQHTGQLLQAFDAGNLFDWLRGEDKVPAQT